VVTTAIAFWDNLASDLSSRTGSFKQTTRKQNGTTNTSPLFPIGYWVKDFK
jgi:hypothetical protein